jgi:zinc transport system permease protein
MIESLLAPWHTFVSSFPFEWARYEFMRHALLAVIIVSPLLGALGTVVVANRMAFFSEAIGHAAITWFRRRGGLSSDTAIGLVMAFTVSLGIVILSRGGDFARYTGFLIGDMLAVTGGDVAGLAVLAVVVCALFFFFFNRLLLGTLSPALARSRGAHAGAAELCFASLLAVVVTCALPWIGILVINALLILPAAAGRNLAGHTAGFFGWSVLIALVSGLAGLFASFYASTATGATIVLAAMVIYLFTLLRRSAS